MNELLKTDIEKGLTQQEASARIKRYGLNAVKKAFGRSFLHIFFGQFQDPFVYLLLGSAGIIFFAGDIFDAYIITGILLLNAVVGSLQEVRIAHVFAQLQDFASRSSLVLRDGIRLLIDSTHITIGDILFLQEGEKVPADAQLIESYGFAVDESLLTGESKEVLKKDGDCVLSGSYVLSGYAKVLVTAIGSKTRLGKIHQTVQTAQVEFPLEKDIRQLLNFILMGIITICVALFVIGIATGKPFAQLLAALMALFICVIPQGLPVIMTVTLVSGAYHMAKRNIFAKKLQAVEGLGRVDVVIMDKTGTLTTNQLMVTSIVACGKRYNATGCGYQKEGLVIIDDKTVKYETADQALQLMGQAAILLNRSELICNEQQEICSVKGSTLEAAMALFAEKMGLTEEHLLQEYNLFYEIPFKSENRYHAGFVEHGDQGLIFMLGSSEVIFERCNNDTKDDHAMFQELVSEGLRVIACAYKSIPLKEIRKKELSEFEVLLQNLEFLGFYGFQDTLRKEAVDIVAALHKAGVEVVMATGDNKVTAAHLAASAGIAQEHSTILEGPVIQKMDDLELIEKLKTTKIIASALPEDKLRLVQLYQEQGKIVAMIGDGVNDAPGLALAQLGIAMGATGADVAKQAADIILLNDSFKSVVDGIAQGRYIFRSFKRVILFFFTTNFSEVAVMVLAFGLNLPLPFLAPQILWLNLVSDGFLDFSLAMEPYETSYLKIQKDTELISRDLVYKIFYQSGIAVAVTFGLFYYYQQTDIALARTMAMVGMTVCSWFMVMNCRSFSRSIFELGITSNGWLFVSQMSIAVLLMGILYTKWGQIIFKVVPLSWLQWQLLLIIGFSLLTFEEFRKRFFAAR